MNYLNSIIQVSEFQNQNHLFETSEICIMSYACSLCCLCLPSFWVVWFVTLYSISSHFISLWTYENKPQATVVVSFTVFGYSLNLRRINSSLRKALDVCSETTEHMVEVPWESLLYQCAQKVGWLLVIQRGTHWTVFIPELNWSKVSLRQDGLKELFYEDENFLIFILLFWWGVVFIGVGMGIHIRNRIICSHPS